MVWLCFCVCVCVCVCYDVRYGRCGRSEGGVCWFLYVLVTLVHRSKYRGVGTGGGFGVDEVAAFAAAAGIWLWYRSVVNR